MRLRDLLLALGGALLGVALGGLLSAGAAGSSFAPARWFWPSVLACGAAGGLTIAGCLVVIVHNAQVQRSRPLELVFDGQGTPCLEEHLSTRDMQAQPDSKGTFTVSGRLVVAAVTIRLPVRNKRSRRLSQVRVRVVRVVTPDGTDVTQRYLLQWINDPPPTYPASHAGITCEPGLDPHAYICVANKRVDRADISLCFANDKLMAQTYTAKDLDLDLAVDSRDEASDIAGPTVTERFRLTVITGGSLSLTRIT